MGKKRVFVGLFIGIIIVTGLTFGILFATRNAGKSDRTISTETAQTRLADMYNKVEPTTADPIKSSIEYTEEDTAAEELPELDTNAVTCWGTTQADYFRGEIPCTRFLNQEETEGDYEAETGRVIVETFKNRNPVHTPAVLVAGHGPFTWGKDAAESVYNAVVLEKTAEIALHTLSLNPNAPELPEWIQEKHFSRKHGKNAYYGQIKA